MQVTGASLNVYRRIHHSRPRSCSALGARCRQYQASPSHRRERRGTARLGWAKDSRRRSRNRCCRQRPCRACRGPGRCPTAASPNSTPPTRSRRAAWPAMTTGRYPTTRTTSWALGGGRRCIRGCGRDQPAVCPPLTMKRRGRKRRNRSDGTASLSPAPCLKLLVLPHSPRLRPRRRCSRCRHRGTAIPKRRGGTGRTGRFTGQPPLLFNG